MAGFSMGNPPDGLNVRVEQKQEDENEGSSCEINNHGHKRKVYSKAFLSSKLAPGTQGNVLLFLRPAGKKLPVAPDSSKHMKNNLVGKKKKTQAWATFQEPSAQENYARFQVRLRSLLEPNAPMDIATLWQLYEGSYGESAQELPQSVGLPDFSLLQLLGTVPDLPVKLCWNPRSNVKTILWDDGGGDCILQAATTLG